MHKHPVEEMITNRDTHEGVETLIFANGVGTGSFDFVNQFDESAHYGQVLVSSFRFKSRFVLSQESFEECFDSQHEVPESQLSEEARTLRERSRHLGGSDDLTLGKKSEDNSLRPSLSEASFTPIAESWTNR